MHVDQVLDLHLHLQSLPREIFRQSSTIVFGGTSRDTCTCIYVYISRTKQALRRLDPVGIIYRLARNGPCCFGVVCSSERLLY